MKQCAIQPKGKTRYLSIPQKDSVKTLGGLLHDENIDMKPYNAYLEAFPDDFDAMADLEKVGKSFPYVYLFSEEEGLCSTLFSGHEGSEHQTREGGLRRHF